MSKVNLNFGPIETTCIPAIDNAMGHINEAVRALQQTSVPGDFYRRTELLNTIANLNSYVSSLNNVKGWLVESNKNYNSMIDKLETQANQLPVDQVKKRNSII